MRKTESEQLDNENSKFHEANRDESERGLPVRLEIGAAATEKVVFASPQGGRRLLATGGDGGDNCCDLN